MASVINASISSNGIVSTADASGILNIQSNGVNTNAQAWINFGYVASAVTTRASYNVSSVVRNASGDYTVNFTNALVDANYCLVGTASYGSAAATGRVVGAYPIAGAYTTTSIRLASGYYNGFEDEVYVNIAIFR